MVAQKKVVSIIPSTNYYESNLDIEQKRISVAAYCRVSTLQDEQESSYEAQIQYYTNQISSNPNWKFVGIYADEGKSGTIKAMRPEFNRLVQDCEKGKINVVLTKSISRFARNTVDCLQTIRRLKEKGIAVVFEKEGINTLEATGELLITILSSQAQEESRSISENVRWGFKRKFESGEVVVNHNKFMGYTKDEEGKLIIVPEEATVVRRIFREYLEGKSPLAIRRGLERDGVKTATGSDKWYDSVIIKMLGNEKYCGDLLMQKTVTLDFLSKKRVNNNGIATQYYVENNHEPIIPKELFIQVQAEKARRSSVHKPTTTRRSKKEGEEKSKYSSKFVLYGILVCGESNHNYKRQVWSKYGVKHAVWRCEDRLTNGSKSKCKHSLTVKEKDLHRAIMEAINTVVKEENQYIETFRQNVIRVIESNTPDRMTKIYDEKIKDIEKKMLILVEESAELGMLHNNFDEKYNALANEMKAIKSEKATELQKLKELKSIEEQIDATNKVLDSTSKQLYEFDEELVKQLIRKIVIKPNGTIEILFISGLTVNRNLTE